MMNGKTFKTISLRDAALSQAINGGTPRVRRGAQIFPASILSVPPVAFGDTDRSLLEVNDEFGLWNAGATRIDEVSAFTIANAVVHPPMGVITIDNHALEESLGHLPYHLPGYGTIDGEIMFPLAPKAIHLPTGLHAMGGNYTNYFHWMLEIVPRLRVDPFAASLADGAVLLSPLETRAQVDVVALFQASRNPLLIMGASHAAEVGSLTFVPNLAGFGFEPNPNLRGFFARLRQLLNVEPAGRYRIYISRKDSRNRVMKNEAEVQALVRSYGYEVIELSGLPLRRQAMIFASASHIVAPHGAGLANLVFCREGTILCEMHTSTYLNPCFRRMAAVQGLVYGCVVGVTDLASGEHGWEHSRQWSAPLDRLEAVLRDQRGS